MIKQCQRCGADFETKAHNAKHCPTCRVIQDKERNRRYYHRDKDKWKSRARQWQKDHPAETLAIAKKYRDSHPEQVKARIQRWRENNPDYSKRWYKKRKQIAKLRAKLQAAKAKRQAALDKHKQLYQPPSMFDGTGIPIPSCLANLGLP